MIRAFAEGVDPEAIRHKASEVFSRPEYNPVRNWWDWLDWPEWLKSFFRWLGSLSVNAPYAFWIMLIGCIILIILIFAYIIRSTIRTSTFAGAAARSRAERLHQSAAHFTLAGECANRGDYTEAIRHLFLSLVFRFDEAGRVVLRPAATNREYLHLLDERLPERRELSTLVDFLDDYWYGQRPSDRGQYERSLNTYQRLTS